MKNKHIRVRVAPSPTGLLHVGTAQSALFNWLFARHSGGQFVIRIEDTDQTRSRKEYEKDIIGGLEWLGIKSDEPLVRQSERTAVYKRYIQKLLDSGRAYWKHYTKEELAAMTTDDGTSKRESVICLTTDKNSNRVIAFDDQIRGRIEWRESLIEDLVIAKDLDTPLYNFSVVIDDIEMEISHVIRGEDHISNTPKQLLIYEALEANPPLFAHLPLLLGTDRSKLSKRHGATSLNEFKKDYLPQALTNFLGILGYTYREEIMSLEEMAEEFELEKVHKSGAIFDTTKLGWINAQYVKKLSIDELRTAVQVPELPASGLAMISERLEKLSDINLFSFLWQDPVYEAGLLKWKEVSAKETSQILEDISKKLEKIEFTEETIRGTLEELAKEYGGRGPVYWPLRVALSGQEKSPDPVQIALAVGPELVLVRIKKALEKLGQDE